MKRLLSSFRYRERGASTVTYVLVLPLFILLVFGTFEIWRIISIRQSMERGVYRAARYLSQHHLRYGDAWGLAHSEVAENSWLMSTNSDSLVLITTPADLTTMQPGDKLIVEVRLPVYVGDLGFLDLFERGSPVWVTLKSHSTTFVDFVDDEWAALDEGSAY